MLLLDCNEQPDVAALSIVGLLLLVALLGVVLNQQRRNHCNHQELDEI